MMSFRPQLHSQKRNFAHRTDGFGNGRFVRTATILMKIFASFLLLCFCFVSVQALFSNFLKVFGNCTSRDELVVLKVKESTDKSVERVLELMVKNHKEDRKAIEKITTKLDDIYEALHHRVTFIVLMLTVIVGMFGIIIGRFL